MRKGSRHDPITLIKMRLAKKGKTWEEIYGEEEAEKKRQKLKETHKKLIGKKRPDLSERNLTNNPMWSKVSQEKSSLKHTIHGKWIGRIKAKRYLGMMWYCWRCGMRENVDVHHIDGNRSNNKIENLEILCHKCHIKIHKGEKFGI